MHPEVSEEQAELKTSVERFWRQQVNAEKLREWESNGPDTGTWQTIAALGWFGIAVPAAMGGSGLGISEAACVLEECGRGLLPPQITHAIRAVSTLAHLDAAAPELAELASGARRLTLAIDERAARSERHFATRLDANRVNGEKWCVVDPAADWHLVAARAGAGDGEIALVLVDGSAAQTSTLRTFDGGVQAAVRYDDVAVARVVATAGPAAETLARVRRLQTALALAEMLGGMQGALEATVDYVKEREQFGQKIGVFQAVQHQVADMSLAYTASRHLVWRAVSRLAVDAAQGVDLETAAAFVARSFKDVTMTAHHLHGGAGYVVEHPLHYHSERAQALAIRYAPEAPALSAVAGSLLD